jgi:hypothetical protein
MPDKLCKDCTEKAYMSYNFKITIEQNDTTLRSVFLKDSFHTLKRDAVFDENSAYLGLGIKTEIAFVDADPFIDDDGEFDYVNAVTQNSTISNQPNDNNNSYSQDDEEILNSEENEEVENEEFEEKERDENSDDKSPKDKAKRKASENADYIKDEDGKFVCQICNKKLVDRKGLNLHVRLHTGENLKRCNICNRGRICVNHYM